MRTWLCKEERHAQKVVVVAAAAAVAEALSRAWEAGELC